jgi:hypothetical protein
MTSVTVLASRAKKTVPNKIAHLWRLVDEQLGDEQTRRTKPILPTVPLFYANQAGLGRRKTGEKPRPVWHAPFRNQVRTAGRVRCHTENKLAVS